MAFKNGFRVCDDKYEREHWTPDELAESEARVALMIKNIEDKKDASVEDMGITWRVSMPEAVLA